MSVFPLPTNHVTVLLSHVAFVPPPTQVNYHDKVTELSAATAVLLVKLRWWWISFENFGWWRHSCTTVDCRKMRVSWHLLSTINTAVVLYTADRYYPCHSRALHYGKRVNCSAFVHHSYDLCPLSQNTATAAAVWTCGSLGQIALCPARCKQTWPPLTAPFVYHDNADIVTLGGSNIGLHSLKPGMMKSDLVKQVPGRCWGGRGQQAITGRPYQAHEGCKLLTIICTFVVKIRAWGPISRHSKGSYRVQEESFIALVYCRLTKIDGDSI